MISYLKGTIVSINKINSHRVTLTLEVNNIGYDLQIPSRLVQELPGIGEQIQVFTHLQIREEQWLLYGFASAAERDLFRQLLGVNGVGPQLALALLDTLGAQELVQAIVTSNTRQLTKAPGVGNKTAERIALELKTKMTEWHKLSGLSLPVPTGVPLAVQEDVEITLLALGYTNNEVSEALAALRSDPNLSKTADAEAWIRASIAWLTRQ
ncbi:MAG: Holliday junction branch migration protein RuvA [Oscillatoriaceae bacterium SKW80]|nr:Holliday junction branch migration protein RuvA [Oscillatoriaceae bacterium SKYG93]MCX8122037.1 Holliday junction branch migration protein RuvA [Oscillatoriaceae bacterium SKW80]MDW8454324.1 Holliday junction branch migration protein RuvA [Oscillatoriaceae cyanobacterium SKYGB_i_bin93]HIK29188.1 Holliday junction branch migration protein RuvA [Oscillatoriaceae cyanobacterium M7585_C2015_266]